jgi:hypothetical protein
LGRSNPENPSRPRHAQDREGVQVTGAKEAMAAQFTLILQKAIVACADLADSSDASALAQKIREMALQAECTVTKDGSYGFKYMQVRK